MFVPACDRPSVAKSTGPQARSVMETRSAKIHRKMPAPPRQLPITGFAHKTTVVRDDGVRACLVLATCNVAAERRRAAALDRRHYLQLVEAHVPAVGFTPSGTVVTENVRDLQTYRSHVGGASAR